MSVYCTLEFLRDGKKVSSHPIGVQYGMSYTPFEYVQKVFDLYARDGEHGFILHRNEPFDTLRLQWPDGTLYTWGSLLIRNAFRVPEFVLRRLVEPTPQTT